MDRRQSFRDLHEHPFLIANPWDAGSAKILASLGFPALATTSAGFANSLGRLDGDISRNEAIAHAKVIVDATPLPVSADLENGFGEEPAEVAETIEQALAAGLAGCSIEDYGDGKIYSPELASERIRAAVEANERGGDALVLTARAENFIRGNPDLADVIKRLQAYQEAGADVLYAPGLMQLDDIRTLVSAVDRPLNVLIMPGGPTVPEIFDAGGMRISTGSAISSAAQSAVIDAARELLGEGSHDFWGHAISNSGAIVHQALSPDA
ncbi:MAG: isocitrate lyase/phosphoenolpyruvate mutase family protein [bacterium]|nr:isocitrate lyase/phosphoenolpyruvate mutase family protein [bacterium]